MVYKEKPSPVSACKAKLEKRMTHNGEGVSFYDLIDLHLCSFALTPVILG